MVMMVNLPQTRSVDSNAAISSGVGSPNSFPRANLPKIQKRTQGRRLMARTRKGKNPEGSAGSLTGKVSLGGQPGFFLRTKLLPPRPAPELLSRPRLTDDYSRIWLIQLLWSPPTPVPAKLPWSLIFCAHTSVLSSGISWTTPMLIRGSFLVM